MESWIGRPGAGPWLVATAFFLLMVPVNLFAGGSLLLAVLKLRGGGPESRLARWLVRLTLEAMTGAVAIGAGALLLQELLAAGVPASGDPIAGSPIGLPRSIAASWPIVPLLVLIVLARFLVGFLARREGDAAVSFAAWMNAGLAAAAGIYCSRAALASALFPPGATTGPQPEESLIPRALHMLLAATAVAGLAVAAHGARRRRADPEYAAFLVREGSLWFAVPTAIQLVVGFWFLLALPQAVRLRFVGASPGATALLAAGVLLALGALLLAARLVAAGRGVPAAAVLTAVLLGVMALMREHARTGYLAATGAVPAHAEISGWRAAMIGAGLALVGVAQWIWIAARLGDADRPPARVAAADAAGDVAPPAPDAPEGTIRAG